MAERARHLHIVDARTGETLDRCPTCAEWSRKYSGLLLQLANLRADKEAEARDHELWPQALHLFDWWKWRTKRDGRTRWTPDRFWTVEPFLKREGYEDCWDALRGLTGSPYHMKRGKYAKRDGPRYDEFERPFKDQPSFERFRGMVAQPHPDTVALFQWFDNLP